MLWILQTYDVARFASYRLAEVELQNFHKDVLEEEQCSEPLEEDGGMYFHDLPTSPIKKLTHYYSSCYLVSYVPREAHDK